jgi:hypothetical protein
MVRPRYTTYISTPERVMSIKSHAFGRVTLTGQDAKKFKAQVTYGRPKAAAVESAKRGVEMSRAFQANGGKVKLTLKRG